MARDWKHDLRVLYRRGDVYVDHDPMSPRYDRAQESLEAICLYGRTLGFWRDDRRKAVEIVIWNEPTSESIFFEELGTYSVVRVFYENGASGLIPTSGVVFCFYDGIEHPDDPDN